MARPPASRLASWACGLGESGGRLVARGALGVAVLGEEEGAGVHGLAALDGEPGEGPGGERRDAGLVGLGPAVEDAVDAAHPARASAAARVGGGLHDRPPGSAARPRSRFSRCASSTARRSSDQIGVGAEGVLPQRRAAAPARRPAERVSPNPAGGTRRGRCRARGSAGSERRRAGGRGPRRGARAAGSCPTRRRGAS